MQRFANPARFTRLADRVLPWTLSLTLIGFGYGLYLALVASPPDFQQGETVRIMYVHVPSSYLAMMAYGLIASASAVSIIWKHPLADVVARAAALPGLIFTVLSLATGSIWGKPMWGTWWVWDARLTSVLLMFFVYLAYILVWRTFEDPAKASRTAAILALVGAVNLPIIKFSVDWWNTLHQPASVFRADGPTIDPSLLTPLFVMAAAFAALFMLLHLLAMRAEILRRRVRALQQSQVEHAVLVGA